MTPKQQRFALEYAVDLNGTRAAVAAGYGKAGAHVTASRLLRNPKVQKALQARQSADATRLSIRREDALQGLLGAIATAREKGEPAAMISGWREIGRMLGFYEPERRQVEITPAAAQAEMGCLQELSDAELLALMEPASG
jgi:hypothetical protein